MIKYGKIPLLTMIDLSCIKIDIIDNDLSHSFYELCDALERTQNKITSFSFRKCNLSNKSLFDFNKLTQSNKVFTMKKLILSDNFFTSESTNEFTKSLATKKAPLLEEVGLSSIYI